MPKEPVSSYTKSLQNKVKLAEERLKYWLEKIEALENEKKDYKTQIEDLTSRGRSCYFENENLKRKIIVIEEELGSEKRCHEATLTRFSKSEGEVMALHQTVKNMTTIIAGKLHGI